MAGRSALRRIRLRLHPLRAFGKLGVSDRTAAVTTAMAMGLLP